MGAVDAIEWTCVLCGRWIQNDWVEQWICIKFHIRQNSFLHGNYLGDSEDLSYGQLVIGSFITTMYPLYITSHAEFFCETSNYPGDSAPLQPRFGTLRHLAFPKTIITFEREEISDHQWDSGKYNRAADGDWENCEVLRCLLWRGWGVTVLCTMFLVFYIF